MVAVVVYKVVIVDAGGMVVAGNIDGMVAVVVYKVAVVGAGGMVVVGNGGGMVAVVVVIFVKVPVIRFPQFVTV